MPYYKSILVKDCVMVLDDFTMKELLPKSPTETEIRHLAISNPVPEFDGALRVIGQSSAFTSGISHGDIVLYKHIRNFNETLKELSSIQGLLFAINCKPFSQTGVHSDWIILCQIDSVDENNEIVIIDGYPEISFNDIIGLCLYTFTI